MIDATKSLLLQLFLQSKKLEVGGVRLGIKTEEWSAIAMQGTSGAYQSGFKVKNDGRLFHSTKYMAALNVP